MQNLFLSEPLHWEETFVSDGFPLLHTSVTLPHVTGTGKAPQRIGRYYQAMFRRLKKSLSTVSLRQASARFAHCQEVAAPFSPTDEEITFQVTLHACKLLSIVVQRKTITDGQLQLRQLGDVWRTDTGLPVKAESLMPRIDRRLLRETAACQFPDLPAQPGRRWDRRNFYLTENHLHLPLSPAMGQEISCLTLPIPTGPVKLS